MLRALRHHVDLDLLCELLELALVLKLLQEFVCLGLWQRRLKELYLYDVIVLLFDIQVHGRVWEVTEPGYLIRDLHTIERQLIQEPVLVHLACNQVCIEL